MLSFEKVKAADIMGISIYRIGMLTYKSY